jgi:putative nucleotidyltransferase with HDIG domain
MIDREQAWQILCEFTKSESLRKHALAVETCVRAYARKLGEDEVKWSVTALLHDFDWEIHPEAPDHPMKGEPILAERGVPEEIRRAILSHANHSIARKIACRAANFGCALSGGSSCSSRRRKKPPERAAAAKIGRPTLLSN